MEEQGLVNSTPLAAEQLLLIDERGREIVVLVVKATYRIRPESRLELSEEQAPVNLVGEYNGEPGLSSFRYEPEVASIKMATDVALIGRAYPQKGEGMVDVTLKVGEMQKSVRVFGDRYWGKTLGFERISPPEPFESLPLHYENAFGGWDRSNDDPEKHACEMRNPVGKGFRHKKFGGFEEGRMLPNIEDPASLIKSSKDAPAPAGFGFIGPGWHPRSEYAGTYDDGWMKSRMPLLPDDFDRRYFNAAHPDLVAGGFLNGDEPVEILNASKHGPRRFNLPATFSPTGLVRFGKGGQEEISTVLDTVIVNTDDDLLMILWRGHLDIHGRLHSMRSITVSVT